MLREVCRRNPNCCHVQADPITGRGLPAEAGQLNSKERLIQMQEASATIPIIWFKPTLTSKSWSSQEQLQYQMEAAKTAELAKGCLEAELPMRQYEAPLRICGDHQK